MKSLIIYGTRYGATHEIAKTIEKTLNAEGFEVEVLQDYRSMKYIISEYDLVIIGSGIKAGKWTQNTLDFLEKYYKELSKIHTAFFVSSGEAMKSSRKKWIEKRYLKRILKKYSFSKTLSLGVFGGVFDFEGTHKGIKNTYLDTIKKQLEENGVDTSKPYDFRDLGFVKNWSLLLSKSIEV
jgi:menaquinone-dependent protoporphyrinogen oxidase